MPTEFKFKPDRPSSLTAEALLLRTSYVYRAARDRAKRRTDLLPNDSDLFAGPEVPSYDQLSRRYDDLLDECAAERPDGPHGALSYVELVLEILADEITTKYREEAGIVSSERDLRYALDLLANVHHWIHSQDINDAVEQERAFRAGQAHRPDGTNEALPSDLAELRSRAEALAAEYTAPLPGEAGDAGLIEAARRLSDVGARDQALYRDPAVGERPTRELERLLEAVLAPARDFLMTYIDETAPETPAGAAIKLRRLCDQDFGTPNAELEEGDQRSLHQVLEWVDQYRHAGDRLREEGGQPASNAVPDTATEDDDWPTLHRRWAQLSARIEALEVEIDERHMKRRGDRKIVGRLRTEHDSLVDARDPVLAAIYERPVTTFEALAVLLDIAIDHGDIDPPIELSDWITTNKLLKALRQLAPAIEFTALRRLYPREVDVEAIIAKA